MQEHDEDDRMMYPRFSQRGTEIYDAEARENISLNINELCDFLNAFNEAYYDAILENKELKWLISREFLLSPDSTLEEIRANPNGVQVDEHKLLRDRRCAIIIGDTREDYVGAQIDLFMIAMRLSEQSEIIVHTNNPIFAEALEVLIGEDNLYFYLKIDNKYEEIDKYEAYDYLGDVFRIINGLRFEIEINEDCDNEIKYDKQELYDTIAKYNERWNQVAEYGKTLKEMKE